LLLVYRVPSEPSRNRVAVWRELKRNGALFLQSCICILPALDSCRAGIGRAVARVREVGGTHYLFELATLPDSDRRRLTRAFRQLAAKECDEIIEECRTRFVSEVAYEHRRANYTYEEAEEIREDLEKIERWFQRVRARDWFRCGRRGAVERELRHCRELLEEFEETVYAHADSDPAVHGESASAGSGVARHVTNAARCRRK